MGYFAIGLLAGLVIGAAIALIVAKIHSRSGEQSLREAFRSLAVEALDANSQALSERAGAALDGKKELIDQAVKAVNERLEHVRTFLQQSETQRRTDFGSLGSSVRQLAQTTGELHQMLASSKRRGAWGERMADDILRLAGLIEGVNYAKQSTADAESGRPDFTFYLPNDLKVNMDVKFPLEHYRTYLDAADDAAREAAAGQLAKDVRGHVRAVASRGYVDVKGGTVDYVILFVPSEQILSLALSAQPDLVDEALGMKVVLASPLTLYAMLSVVRQIAQSANLMKTADEVLGLLAAFNNQWQRYNEELDKLGRGIETVAKSYETLRTTRANLLQKPLDRIEDLRQARGLGED